MEIQSSLVSGPRSEFRTLGLRALGLGFRGFGCMIHTPG